MAIQIFTNDNQKLFVNHQVISTLRVVPLPTNPLTYGIDCVILPGKSLLIQIEGVSEFATRQAAGQALEGFIETLPQSGGGSNVDLSDYFNKTEINSMLGDKVDKNANITAGTHPKITYDAKGLVTGGGALAATDIPNLNASKINAGAFDAARIPSLEASKIGSGTFDDARIPSLAASKIGSGTFDAARIPNLAPTKITQNASNRFVTDTEKASWDGKQDKLVAGTNITIDEITNVISASGGSNVDLEWANILNKPTFATVATSGAYADLTGKPDLDLKVDKVSGMGLSSNDFTTTEKNKLSGIQAGAQVNAVTTVAGRTGAVVLLAGDIPNLNASKINAGEFDAARIPSLAPTKITQNESNRFVTDIEKASWDGKQDKLVAGDNITIDPTTNVISAIVEEVALIQSLVNRVETLEQEIEALKETPE